MDKSSLGISIKYNFGGVIYEEDGVRSAKKGDYSLFADSQLIYWSRDDLGLAWSIILKPIVVEKEKHEGQ